MFMFSLDMIVQSDHVEGAKAEDKWVFTGTIIVAPNVSQLGESSWRRGRSFPVPAVLEVRA
jgi:hypothetical protein